MQTKPKAKPQTKPAQDKITEVHFSVKPLDELLADKGKEKEKKPVAKAKISSAPKRPLPPVKTPVVNQKIPNKKLEKPARSKAKEIVKKEITPKPTPKPATSTAPPNFGIKSLDELQRESDEAKKGQTKSVTSAPVAPVKKPTGTNGRTSGAEKAKQQIKSGQGNASTIEITGKRTNPYANGITNTTKVPKVADSPVVNQKKDDMQSLADVDVDLLLDSVNDSEGSDIDFDALSDISGVSAISDSAIADFV